MKFLRQNLGLKLLALFLALCAWSAVRLTAAPTVEIPAQRVFFKPLERVEPDSAGLAYDITSKEVVVTLRGKRSVLERISSNQISATVDLTTKTVPGDFMVKVNVLAPGGVDVSDVEPTHVWVQVQRSQAERKPVRVQVLGQPAEGFKVGTPDAEPRSVRVVGPPTSLELVSVVLVPTNLAGANRTFSTRARFFQPVDSSGRAVPGVEVQSEGVDITIPMNAVGSVPVDISQVTVQGAQGWSYQVQAEPSALTLEGSPDITRPAALKTEPLKMKHSAQIQTREVRVLVPDGLSPSGEGKVRIRVTPTPPPPQK